MTTSSQGLLFIKKWEGVRQDVYLDPVGLPTVGVGHLLSPNEVAEMPVGSKLSLEQVDQLLVNDLAKAENAIKSLVTYDINQSQFDALVSFVFNVGIGNFKTSTLLKDLNKGNTKGAGEEFLRWNQAGHKVIPGLAKRRLAESELFLTGDYGNGSAK